MRGGSRDTDFLLAWADGNPPYAARDYTISSMEGSADTLAHKIPEKDVKSSWVSASENPIGEKLAQPPIAKLQGPFSVNGATGAALSRARRMRCEQEDETAPLGRTFARDADKANAFSKLSRYETSIERQIYRALHELERRQAARSGAAVTPPQVVDVDVSGIPEGAG